MGAEPQFYGVEQFWRGMGCWPASHGVDRLLSLSYTLENGQSSVLYAMHILIQLKINYFLSICLCKEAVPPPPLESLWAVHILCGDMTFS